MQKTALIIGINGMDARSLSFLLLSKNYKVIGTHRRNTLNISEVHKVFDFNPNISFEYCDITDYESIKDMFLRFIESGIQIDECYLLAAQSHVGFSFNSPHMTVFTNGMSVFYFCDTIKELSLKTKLYFAATSELFGGRHEEPCNELSTFDCRSPYSIGKELGTRWIKYYRQLGVFCCYGILFNHSNTDRSKDFFIRKVTNTAAKIALGQEKELRIGHLDFARDEHWSDFGCEMMWKMLQNETPTDYVVANGETHWGQEFIEHAFNYFNLNWKKYIVFDKQFLRPNEVIKLVGDSTKAQQELGWRPNRISFKEHIELMCKYDYDLERGLNPARPNVFELYP